MLCMPCKVISSSNGQFHELVRILGNDPLLLDLVVYRIDFYHHNHALLANEINKTCQYINREWWAPYCFSERREDDRNKQTSTTYEEEFIHSSFHQIACRDRGYPSYPIYLQYGIMSYYPTSILYYHVEASPYIAS